MRSLSIKEVQHMLLELMKKVHTFMCDNKLEYYLLGGSALGAVRHNGFIPWDDDIDIGLKRDDYERFIEISNTFDSSYEVVNFRQNNNCDFALTRIYIPNTYIANSIVKNKKLDTRLYFDIFPLDNVPDDPTLLKKFERKIIKKKRIIQLIDVRDYGSSKIRLAIKQVISFFLRPFRANILKSFDKLAKKYRYQNTAHICSLCSQYSFKKQVMLKEIYGSPVLHKFEDSEFNIPHNVHAYLTTLFGEDYMTLPPEEKRRKGFDVYLLNEE